MEIHVYIGNKSNGFACETLRQILVSISPPSPLSPRVRRYSSEPDSTVILSGIFRFQAWGQHPNRYPAQLNDDSMAFTSIPTATPRSEPTRSALVWECS